MADKLEGIAFRVFRSLIREWDRSTPEQIRVELTKNPPYYDEQEILEALRGLEGRGYVAERPAGHWEVTPQGHGVKRSLLGEIEPS